jgi:hypothetical protein
VKPMETSIDTPSGFPKAPKPSFLQPARRLSAINT